VTRVAIDAIGGDLAPAAIVRGALDAVRELPGMEVILVGREDAIRSEIEGVIPGGSLPPGLTIVHAEQVLEMHESPVEALRRKPDTSIAVAMRLVASGDADALVSAGNTGGTVAAATFALQRMAGARRAGIAAPFPTRTGHCVLVDVGANLQAKAPDLVQYAVMASEYVRAVMGVDAPRVAVLSVGGEEGKGSPLVRRAAEALRVFPGVEFIGNVEGQEIFRGGADVILCEGFVGNVILKASEGLLEAFVHHMLAELGGEVGPSGDDVLEDLRNRTDYTRYGGAQLLGHQGAILICHGRSPPSAIRNAVEAVDRCVGDHVNERILSGLSALAANEDVARVLANGPGQRGNGAG